MGTDFQAVSDPLDNDQETLPPVSQTQPNQRTTDLDEEMEELDTNEIYSHFKCVTACGLQASESVPYVVLRRIEPSE